MSRSTIAAVLAYGLLACSGSSGESVATSDTSAIGGAALPPQSERIVAAGTPIRATIQESISSRSAAAGQRVKAIVSLNVIDAGGHIVIPGGSEIVLAIAKLERPKIAGAGDGMIALSVHSIVVGTTSYEPTASVSAVPHTLQSRDAATPNDRDLIVTPGTPITITITQPLKISAN